MIRSPGLRTVLVATTVALVGAAVLVVGLAAVRLLGRLAQEQALARVGAAGTSAVEEVEQTGEDLDTTARMLAEAPALVEHLGDTARGLRPRESAEPLGETARGLRPGEDPEDLGDTARGLRPRDELPEPQAGTEWGLRPGEDPEDLGDTARGLRPRAPDPTGSDAGGPASLPVGAIGEQQEEQERLRQLLERLPGTGAVDGCAVLEAGHIVSAGRVPLPWDAIAARAATTVDGWFVIGERQGGPIMIAEHAVPGLQGVRVVVARRLDGDYAAEIARHVGLAVEIVDRERALSEAGDRRAVLWGRAATDAVAGSARVDAAAAFVNVQPIKDSTGAVVAIVETRLDTAEVDASVRELAGLLLASTLAVGAVAAVVALLIGRTLVRPLETLTEASARIGSGDLSSPVPRAGRAEAEVLASAMEEMRVRLLQLTAELARRRAQAEAVLSGIVEGVWAVDRERRITWLNPQAAAMLGVEAEDAVGRFCGDVLDPVLPGGERPCEEACPILDARFRGRARATERLRLAGGHERNVVITSAPPTETEGDSGVAFQQFQVLRDETELEAARRLRDAVLANVSHEFRTPLSAQLASLEMLRDRLRDSPVPELGELVCSAERATLKLTRLVDNLLESLRIEAGREAIRRQPVQLDTVVEEALELTRPLIVQRHQQLELNLPWPLPTVVADGPRLVQVFVNLLANANKFAPAGSSIRMGGDVTPQEIAVWVEDEGPGLPEEFGERLFERFLRAPGEEPEQSGMGLGLFIVNSIVKRHGGRVVARNTGSGARITVVLPRSEGDEDPGRRR